MIIIFNFGVTIFYFNCIFIRIPSLKKLKIRIMIWGAFLIVGAIADQDIMPNLVSSVNDLPGSIQVNVMSRLPGDIQPSPSFAATLAEMSSGIDQLRPQLTATEQYMQMGSIAMGVIGVGLVAYGGLAKNNTKFDLKTQDTPLEILKRRLAKGEITKREFDNLKQYIQ
jgi:hypothetical protein